MKLQCIGAEGTAYAFATLSDLSKGSGTDVDNHRCPVGHREFPYICSCSCSSVLSTYASVFKGPLRITRPDPGHTWPFNPSKAPQGHLMLPSSSKKRIHVLKSAKLLNYSKNAEAETGVTLRKYCADWEYDISLKPILSDAEFEKCGHTTP